MKKTMLLTGIAALLVSGLLFLTGCPSSVTPPEPRTGTVTVGFEGENDFLRTILPDVDETSFDRIDLIFTQVTTPPSTPLAPIVWSAVMAPIELAVGTWTLTANAFFTGDALPAATGGTVNATTGVPEANFTVATGATTPLTVRLAPIASGTGTFSWDITFAGGTFSRADMVVTPDAAYPLDPLGTVNLLIRGADTVEWPAGNFSVSVFLENGAGETQTVGPIVMRVYQNLDSLFEETFTLANFPRTLFEMIMSAWDTTAYEWDFAAVDITEAHFYLLDIEIDSTLVALTGYFNDLSYEFGPPSDAYELAEMVDAAEVMNLNHDFTQFVERSAAQEDIEDLVEGLNDSALNFAWVSGATYYTVTVGVGSVYEVEFVFNRLAGTVAITNAGAQTAGVYTVGDTLTADVTGLANVGTNSFQWLRADPPAAPANIGTDAATYQLVLGDVDYVISVRVRRAGYFGEVIGGPTGVVVAAVLAPGYGGVSITFQEWNGIDPIAALPGPFSITNPTPPSITLAQTGVSLITWYLGGTQVGTGATLPLNAAVHGNRVGTHVLTVRATIDDRQYSLLVRFTTTL